jgi:hypothetical protein
MSVLELTLALPPVFSSCSLLLLPLLSSCSKWCCAAPRLYGALNGRDGGREGGLKNVPEEPNRSCPEKVRCTAAAALLLLLPLLLALVLALGG